jgi:BolA protein
MTTAEKIATILQRDLAATYVDVEDESALHAGHAGAASGGGHYRVTVVSSQFEGKTLIARHRLVYAALANEMQRDIHALALTTLTPDQHKG